jgi:Ca2+-binding EF-hand superfamily protein
MEERLARRKPLKDLKANDFDAAIMFGRDDALFVKREYLDKFTALTRYTEEELKNLKLIYVSYAEVHFGLDLAQFSLLLSALMNIEAHPFFRDIFLFFDKDLDGKVDFYELVIGLDIIERGTFDEKCSYCFEMYDIYGLGELDLITLRSLLKRSFSTIVVQLDKAVQVLNGPAPNQ